MIIFPQPDEKAINGLNTTTQVYYASMPGPRPASVSVEGDVDNLARQFDASLNVEEDHPPAYEAHMPEVQIPANTAPNGDVKNRDSFHDKPSGDNDGGDGSYFPSRDPPSMPTPRGFNNPGGSGRAPFQPLVLHSRSKRLEDGFYAMLPPTDINPHPFTQRDVRESDWTKFLSDLQTSARLSPSGSPLGERTNFFKNMGNLIRSFSATAAGKQAEQGTHRGPGALIDTWNENFFHRRGLDVVLAKGSQRLNGNKSLPPPDSSPSDANAMPHSRSSMPHMTPVNLMPTMPPLPGPLMNQGHDIHRSHSVTSFSSISSSDSDSDSDSGHNARRPRPRQYQPPHARPRSHSHERIRGYESMYTSKAERRAARWARRAERRAYRVERRERKRARRIEHKIARFVGKAARWEARVTIGVSPLGMGMGMGPSGYGRGRGMGCGRGFGCGRGGYHRAMWSEQNKRGPLGMGMGLIGTGVGFPRGVAGPMGGEDDGYYRLVVTDLV